MIWAMQRLTFLLYHSEGLKRAEIENKQLRENFIETRDKLELAQQNHRKALNDLHDQTLSTARREEDMKEKMKAMNKEFYKEIQGLEEASRSQVSSCNISILSSSVVPFVQSVEGQFYCCGPLIDARD